MNENLSEKFLSIASQLAQEAAQLILTFQNKPIKKKQKADQTPVTEADLAADQLIRVGLSKAFCEHGILTEESGLSGNTDSEWIWVVDPLDGTKAFAKGIPGYSVMIGLLKKGQPYLGVVVDPVEGHVYEAMRGKGCFHYQVDPLSPRGRGLGRGGVHVSARNQFSKMPLVVSTSYPKAKVQDLQKRLGSPLIEPINSVGIKVGLLVRQVGDIYVNHHGVHYWDTCAPQIILEEAGGVFTYWDGSPLSYGLDGKFKHPAPTVASNGVRHEDVVEILKA